MSSVAVVRLLVDAAAAPLRPATALFPPDGEYARAIAALAGGAGGAPLLPLLPDRAVLSIYACELAERLREQARAAAGGGTRTVHAPFWPELLFVAADELVNPAREVERLWPPLASVTFVERDVATLRAASQRLLGGERCDLERYVSGALAFANAGRFERIVP